MKTIFIFLTGIFSTILYAQNNSGFILTGQNSHKLGILFSAVETGQTNFALRPDLSDFRSKLQQGLDFMYKGSTVNQLNCLKVTDWNDSISNALSDFLSDDYKSSNKNPDADFIKQCVLALKDNQSRLGIVNWEIEIYGKKYLQKSIAVFDKNWNTLFDSELKNFILSSELIKSEDGENLLDAVGNIKNQDSQTKSRTLGLSGPFGSVQLHYETRVTAIVPPYITASTNDAEYNYFTNYITCERINESGISPPKAKPFCYFGTGGEYAVLYQNAVPSVSTISFSNNADRFNTGTYKITGFNGNNWSFDFDFSVDFPGGSIGITPVSNISALSLSPNNNSSINMQNYIYNNNVAAGDIRAVFFDGGSLNLDNFKILTSGDSGETNKINVTSKFQVGYLSPNAVGVYAVPNFFNETSSAFSFPVTYLRGDHVHQPGYQLSSTNHNISLGHIDTLKVKVINNSNVVQLTGGTVSLDVSSLNGNLTILSAATLSIGTIDTSASAIYKFIVRGNSDGIVTPQAQISAMGWGLPVPPNTLINNIVSIDSNIVVGSPKILQLTMLIQGLYNSISNQTVRDTASVYLRNIFSPYAIVDSSKAFLSSNGSASFAFGNALNSVPYYIQLKHRNSIQTWSANGNVFSSSLMIYDFTTSDSKAFGNNQIQIDNTPVKFAIYNGDVNQDGVIDATDNSAIDNDVSNFVTGYAITDLTGDIVVDASDAAIADNNAFNFVGLVRP